MTRRRRVLVLGILGIFLAGLLSALLIGSAGPTAAGSLSIAFAGLTNDPAGAVLVQFKVINGCSRRVSFGIGEVQVLQSNSWPNWMRVAGGSNWLGVAAGASRMFAVAGSSLEGTNWRVPILYAEEPSTLDSVRWKAKGLAWVISHWRPGHALPWIPSGRRTATINSPEMIGLSLSSAHRTDPPDSKGGTGQTPGTPPPSQ